MFTRWTQEADTCLSLQLASLDLNAICTTFRTGRCTAAEKAGRLRVSPHVPLPPAIWSMSYTSVSKLSICAHWWERTATPLQLLPWCRESCCSTIWKVEHHHQLPGLAIGMRPFVTHGLAPMAYGMHHLLKGLNPILLKEPSTEIIYLSCKLYTIHYIYKIYTMPKFKFVTTGQLTS